MRKKTKKESAERQFRIGSWRTVNVKFKDIVPLSQFFLTRSDLASQRPFGNLCAQFWLSRLTEMLLRIYKAPDIYQKQSCPAPNVARANAEKLCPR